MNGKNPVGEFAITGCPLIDMDLSRLHTLTSLMKRQRTTWDHNKPSKGDITRKGVTFHLRSPWDFQHQPLIGENSVDSSGSETNSYSASESDRLEEIIPAESRMWTPPPFARVNHVQENHVHSIIKEESCKEVDGVIADSGEEKMDSPLALADTPDDMDDTMDDTTSKTTIELETPLTESWEDLGIVLRDMEAPSVGFGPTRRLPGDMVMRSLKMVLGWS